MRTFNVHALGPSGSGKTVFMASLYNRLRLRRPDLTFYLKTEHEASLQLNALYNRIANPAESWPEASQAVHEWRFRTVVPTPSGDFEPLEFAYLDYPGGALTNPRAMEDSGIQELVQRLRSANALLVLLDGQAMLSLLADERLGRRYLEFDIISSLEIAQQSRCPVHFAITKWDLLEGRHTLSDVRARLMEDENFAHLIEAKAQDMPGTIRLFPVSAVGFGFAELLPSGEMRKVGDRPRPWQVELPLLSVFPDFFTFAFDELRTAEGDLSELRGAQMMQKLLDPSSTSKLRSLVRGVFQKALPMLQASIAERSPALASVVAVGGDFAIDDVLDFAERLVRDRAERASREHAADAASEVQQRRQKVATEKAALELLERQCTQLVANFEQDHPESVLTGGFDRFEFDAAWVNALRTGAPLPERGSADVAQPAAGAADSPEAIALAILERPFVGTLPDGHIVAGLHDRSDAAARQHADKGVVRAIAGTITSPGDSIATLDLLLFKDPSAAETFFGEGQLGIGLEVQDTFVPPGFDRPVACVSYRRPPAADGGPGRGGTTCLAHLGALVVVAGSEDDQASPACERTAQALLKVAADHALAAAGPQLELEVAT